MWLAPVFTESFVFVLEDHFTGPKSDQHLEIVAPKCPGKKRGQLRMFMWKIGFVFRCRSTWEMALIWVLIKIKNHLGCVTIKKFRREVIYKCWLCLGGCFGWPPQTWQCLTDCKFSIVLHLGFSAMNKIIFLRIAPFWSWCGATWEGNLSVTWQM